MLSRKSPSSLQCSSLSTFCINYQMINEDAYFVRLLLEERPQLFFGALVVVEGRLGLGCHVGKTEVYEVTEVRSQFPARVDEDLAVLSSAVYRLA